jgi:hypothetical protein
MLSDVSSAVNIALPLGYIFFNSTASTFIQLEVLNMELLITHDPSYNSWHL